MKTVKTVAFVGGIILLALFLGAGLVASEAEMTRDCQREFARFARTSADTVRLLDVWPHCGRKLLQERK